MTTRHPPTWRDRLFCFGLFAGGASFVVLFADTLLAAAYGWNTSILLSVLNGDTWMQVCLLWWICLIVISLHARD